MSNTLQDNLNEKDKALMAALAEASKPVSFFTLKLEYNKKTVAEKSFPAEKYSPKSIEETRLHFLIVDFVRVIKEELRKTELNIKDEKTSEE